MYGFHINDEALFDDPEATKKAFSIVLPQPTLVREQHKVIKGCVSEAIEIAEAAGNANTVEDFIRDWDGNFHSRQKTLEELVDLLLYTCSALQSFGETEVNKVIEKVINKNFARGYYTNTEYKRDNTRGY